ncbi:MAG: sulfatase-like hydrolase/transferase [Pirellulales bacterium]
MNRRIVRAAVYAAMFIIGSEAFAAEVGGGASADGPRRPNILYIVCDDLGWSDVGWHQGFAKTPVMDRLVSQGVELDRHYVQPVCTPTRTAR